MYYIRNYDVCLYKYTYVFVICLQQIDVSSS